MKKATRTVVTVTAGAKRGDSGGWMRPQHTPCTPACTPPARRQGSRGWGPILTPGGQGGESSPSPLLNTASRTSDTHMAHQRGQQGGMRLQASRDIRPRAHGRRHCCPEHAAWLEACWGRLGTGLTTSLCTGHLASGLAQRGALAPRDVGGEAVGPCPWVGGRPWPPPGQQPQLPEPCGSGQLIEVQSWTVPLGHPSPNLKSSTIASWSPPLRGSAWGTAGEDRADGQG